MTTLNITCKQRDYLVCMLKNIECITEPGQPTPPNSGFKVQTDPENEVIFDPENEVIFDPENEVIFDPQQVLDPADSNVVLNGFQNLYDCYGNRLNLLNSKMELIKLIYWLFTYEQYRSQIENSCPDSSS